MAEDIFRASLNTADVMFLEALAREHPTELRVRADYKCDPPKLQIETLGEPGFRLYLVHMLQRLQGYKAQFERAFESDSWGFLSS